MARVKNVDNTDVKHKAPSLFLTQEAAKTTTKMVSVRINEVLLSRFKIASDKARLNGFELSMTAVVHRALEIAVQEVEGLELVQRKLV